MGGEHTVWNIYDLLLNCTLETYWIYLTDVTITNKLIKKRKESSFKELIQINKKTTKMLSELRMQKVTIKEL